MRKFLTVFALVFLVSAFACAAGDVEFYPVSHASFVMKVEGKVFYVDPVGEGATYEKSGRPDLILITHAHPDHLDKKLLAPYVEKKVPLLAPRIVTDELGYGELIENGQVRNFGDISIEAVPAYNLTADRLNFHPKGKGNGYVITAAGTRVYISGDTEDIPEMRALKNIDYAFLCINLPYTMTEEQAASAALEFRPKVVIPYHYRGKEKVSDLEKFKSLIAADKGIEVRLLKWY